MMVSLAQDGAITARGSRASVTGCTLRWLVPYTTTRLVWRHPDRLEVDRASTPCLYTEDSRMYVCWAEAL